MHPPGEKSPLLPRIGIPNVNIIPFPQIVTPASTPHSSYYPHPSDSPRSPLSPPASILIEDRRYLPRPATASSSRRNSPWGHSPPLPEGLTFAAFIQALLSGVASLLGWDMVTGCLLYAPNESFNVIPTVFPNPTPSHQALGMTCGTSNAYGIILSIFLTIISSIIYFRSLNRSKATLISAPGSGGTSLRVNFATFAMTPMACLLASTFTAVILLTDVSANIGAVCHLGSALCTSVFVIASLLK